MKIISTRTHGMIDYIVGVVLILAPFIFQFANGGAAMWVPIALGIAIIVYSLMTNYELGATHSISMPAHLWMDGIGGLFLALSPWLFGFAELVYLPHLLVGIAEILVAAMTRTQPSVSYTGDRSVA